MQLLGLVAGTQRVFDHLPRPALVAFAVAVGTTNKWLLVGICFLQHLHWLLQQLLETERLVGVGNVARTLLLLLVCNCRLLCRLLGVGVGGLEQGQFLFARRTTRLVVGLFDSCCCCHTRGQEPHAAGNRQSAAEGDGG